MGAIGADDHSVAGDDQRRVDDGYSNGALGNGRQKVQLRYGSEFWSARANLIRWSIPLARIAPVAGI